MKVEVILTALVISFFSFINAGIVINSTLDLGVGYYSISVTDEYILVVSSTDFIIIDNQPQTNLSIIGKVKIPTDLSPDFYDQLYAVPNSNTDFLYVHKNSSVLYLSQIRIVNNNEEYSIEVINSINCEDLTGLGPNVGVGLFIPTTTSEIVWFAAYNVLATGYPYSQCIFNLNVTSFTPGQVYSSYTQNPIFKCAVPMTFGRFGFYNPVDQYIVGQWENIDNGAPCTSTPPTYSAFFAKIGVENINNPTANISFIGPADTCVPAPVGRNDNSGLGFYINQSIKNYVNSTISNFDFNEWQTEDQFTIQVSYSFTSFEDIYSTILGKWSLVGGESGVRGVVVALPWNDQTNQIGNVPDDSYRLTLPFIPQNLYSNSNFAFAFSNLYESISSLIYRLDVE